ncbi:helix-turn-helix domain-containing protein [Plantactinospora sp. WMMC1484]|uniref:helix-turn-helix domain-containing protein n=1 Tax=Plantactinospora sp. WMMC1484 TaxID=3404122 RepID=UPI003BF4C2D9
MARGLTTLTGSHSSRAVGIVSGYVLKIARQSAALTQEKLAEKLTVDVSTVQGWESGRRPLSAINAGDFFRLCGRLSRLGAPASTGRHLREAIEADQVLSTGITAGATWVNPDSHPLATSVHRWTTTNLIIWPITEKMPQHLHEFRSYMPRRGPNPSQPTLDTEERRRFFDHLLFVAEHARRANEALLHRQAVYLLGFDGRSRVADWLRAEWNRAGRRKVEPGDVTGLLEARSSSVALAVAGDSTHLYKFVEQVADGPGEVANLNYWAYWIGELSNDQISDAFMLDTDTRSWTGARLLHHLMNRLQPDSPHLPLNLCTLHALFTFPTFAPSWTSCRPRVTQRRTR